MTFPISIEVLHTSNKKNVPRELINLCYKGGKKHFIAVSKISATWTDNESKLKIKFQKFSLKLAIDFLLDTCFFLLSTNHWYSHGYDPPLSMANLFLLSF